MAASPEPTTPATDGLTVPFERVAGLVRHLTHDIRNGLNTLDLQSAFLQELTVDDAETLPEVKRLRGMITTTAKMLQTFSANFWLPQMQPVSYTANILIEDLRSRLITVIPELGPQIAWSDELGEESICIDIEMVFRAFSEFFKNAQHFREKDRPVSVRVFAENGRFVLELLEGKTALPSPPEAWGIEPLVSTRRGGFGMGLFHARQLLALHDGTVSFVFDPTKETLTTRLTLPLVPV